MARRALIVAGGAEPHRSVFDRVGTADLVVAADGGADHLVAVGRWPDLLVGDMDSISERTLARAKARGVQVETHPTTKDKTDLELALDAVVERGAVQAVVLAVGGDRFDHQLANLAVLCSPAYRSCRLTAVVGETLVKIVWDRRRINGSPGDTVSLLALLGPASGITTSGLVYPLVGEGLEAGSSRGVSNELVGEQAEISVGSGVVVVIQPGALAPPGPGRKPRGPAR